MRKIYRLSSVLMFFLCSAQVAGAQIAYEEIQCEQIKKYSGKCDVCFDGGTKKINESFTPEMTLDSGHKLGLVFFEDENKRKYKTKVLNRKTEWEVSDNLLGYDPDLKWHNENEGKYAGKNYFYIEKNENARIYATRPGKSITLAEADGQSSDKPDLRVTMITHVRDFYGKNDLSKKRKRNTCVFYHASTD